MADLTWWCIFIHLTTRPSTDGKRAPLTAISLQAVGSHKEATPTYRKDVVNKKLGKNVIFFSQNHTEINSYDWTITKKTTRTIKHENFSKMKILKVDRWALSLNSVKYWFILPTSEVLLFLAIPWTGPRRESREYDVIWGDSSNHAVTAMRPVWTSLQVLAKVSSDYTVLSGMYYN